MPGGFTKGSVIPCKPVNDQLNRAEIGRILGISTSRVFQIEHEAIEKIRLGILADPVLRAVAYEMAHGDYIPVGGTGSKNNRHAIVLEKQHKEGEDCREVFDDEVDDLGPVDHDE